MASEKKDEDEEQVTAAEDEPKVDAGDEEPKVDEELNPEVDSEPQPAEEVTNEEEVVSIFCSNFFSSNHHQI